MRRKAVSRFCHGLRGGKALIAATSLKLPNHAQNLSQSSSRRDVTVLRRQNLIEIGSLRRPL